MSEDHQQPEPPGPDAATTPTAADPVDAVPLPTRTPADAADVFFQARQVDAPGVAEDPGADPRPTAAVATVAEDAGADPRPTAAVATVVESPVAVVVPVGEDLTGSQLSVPDDPPVDRFGEEWPVVFAFNHHQVAGSGEDSDPVLRTGRDVGLLAVFDGMGGAGGTVYETPDGPRSGAYLSSRVARDVAEQNMIDWLNADDGSGAGLRGDGSDDGGGASGDDDSGAGGQAAALVQRSVQEALQARLAELRAPASRLRSKLLRALPTTMAMAAVQRRPGADQMWDCDVLWAGDSRVYALDAAGLHQLTVDDIRDHGDAMANLRDDSVVSNAMSADTPYVVNHRQVGLSEPVVLVAATDGCFGYLPSPMHFEHLLLSTLHDAATPAQWSDAARNAIVAVAGDDASMAVAAVGGDLETLKALTADRLRTVRQEWVGPLDAASAEVDQLTAELDSARQRQVELSAALWEAYRPEYSRDLPIATSRDLM